MTETEQQQLLALGGELRTARKALKLKQHHVAAAISKSTAQICRFEKGDSEPGTLDLLLLSAVLKLNLSALAEIVGSAGRNRSPRTRPAPRGRLDGRVLPSERTSKRSSAVLGGVR